MKKTVKKTAMLCALVALVTPFYSTTMDSFKNQKLRVGIQAMENYLKYRDTQGPNDVLVNIMRRAGTPQDYMTFLTANETTYGPLMDQFIALQAKVEESDEEGGDMEYRNDLLIKFFEPALK